MTLAYSLSDFSQPAKTSDRKVSPRRARALVFAIAAVAGLSICGTAAARPAPNTMIERVPYGDLNLSRPTDQQLLRGRVTKAAHKVCRGMLPDLQQHWLCVSEARNSAKSQVQDAIVQASLQRDMASLDLRQ
jgi:UrcA family protein